MPVDKPDTTLARRGSGRHRQVSGFIDEDLVKELKIALARREINQSVALEEAVALWLAQQHQAVT